MAQANRSLCNICVSPYRKEIEKAYKMNVRKTGPDGVIGKYAGLLGLSEDGFQGAFYNHNRPEHLKRSKRLIVIDPGDREQTGGVGAATVENYAKTLLEIGIQKLTNEDPERVRHQDIVNAQKLLLEGKKIKISERESEVKMAAFLSGLGTVPEVLEGDVDEPTRLPAGDEPGNTN